MEYSSPVRALTTRKLGSGTSSENSLLKPFLSTLVTTPSSAKRLTARFPFVLDLPVVRGSYFTHDH